MNIEIITSATNTIYYHDTDHSYRPFLIKTDTNKFKHIALHREDGPAIIWSKGDVAWYLETLQWSFEDWCKILNKSEEEINFLKLKWNIL